MSGSNWKLQGRSNVAFSCHFPKSQISHLARGENCEGGPRKKRLKLKHPSVAFEPWRIRPPTESPPIPAPKGCSNLERRGGIQGQRFKELPELGYGSEVRTMLLHNQVLLQPLGIGLRIVPTLLHAVPHHCIFFDKVEMLKQKRFFQAFSLSSGIYISTTALNTLKSKPDFVFSRRMHPTSPEEEFIRQDTTSDTLT